MAQGVRKCKVCGCEYPYCKTNRPAGVFRYQDVACCPEHANIYFARIAESRKKADEEVEEDVTEEIVEDIVYPEVDALEYVDDEDEEDLDVDEDDEEFDDEDDEEDLDIEM